ncbi:Uncharacterized BCR, YaiI/YqxD family COG1671 [Lacicoccus alkaliphilus]|uniref:Uncharacterized BCR, YaiI/YqxD family COG1671 n=1 Tax=Lacicoccus alkaliphilus DSM 16010 TaxID=1123231 RepID=A0A1M7EIR2_9BACL|nr:Uncharacterized BCR, YaiI/YqxD family COG1671 [Salinicoccus alkaliphilus DSM 16010]
MKIIVDADACPVKDIIFKETSGLNIPVTLVSSLSHFSNQDVPAHVGTIYVDAGRDAADFKIVALTKKTTSSSHRITGLPLCFCRKAQLCSIIRGSSMMR